MAISGWERVPHLLIHFITWQLIPRSSWIFVHIVCSLPRLWFEDFLFIVSNVQLLNILGSGQNGRLFADGILNELLKNVVIFSFNSHFGFVPKGPLTINTVKPVYNDHLMGYFSAFWSSARWPRATSMSSRRQKLLARVYWYIQSPLKHFTE